MPLSPDQEKTLLLLELGKQGDETAIELVDLLWARYGDRATADPRLPALLVKRDLLMAFLGLNAETGLRWEEAGVVEDDSKLLANYGSLLELVNAQLRQIQGAGVAVGQLTATTPIRDKRGLIDPNDRFYRGDPLRFGGPYGR